jgi:hypothetical protein
MGPNIITPDIIKASLRTVLCPLWINNLIKYLSYKGLCISYQSI